MRNSKLTQIAAACVLMATANVTTASDEWEFALSPLFLWGMSINGDATIDGTTAPLDLESLAPGRMSPGVIKVS